MDEFSDIGTIFFSYLIVRTSAIQIFSSNFSYLFLRREIQAVLALLMLVTVMGFISDVFFFSKVFNFIVFICFVGVSNLVSLLIDIQLALCYMVVFFGHATRLTPLQLEVILTEGSCLSFGIVDLGLFPNALNHCITFMFLRPIIKGNFVVMPKESKIVFDSSLKILFLCIHVDDL
ncbi:hypothetical protein MKX03_007056 [Papaver bracteatum]|nr:hypothetical protein MKX03_007056 [Papaver bracteatum]